MIDFRVPVFGTLAIVPIIGTHAKGYHIIKICKSGCLAETG